MVYFWGFVSKYFIIIISWELVTTIIKKGPGKKRKVNFQAKNTFQKIIFYFSFLFFFFWGGGGVHQTSKINKQERLFSTKKQYFQ